jgi:hypothetical protein
MTTHTDSAVEDRIRAAFEQMMPVILGEGDLRNLRQAAHDPGIPLVDDHIAGFIAAGERPRRTSAMLVALASCVVLIVGGIALFSRRVAEVDESPVAAIPTDGDILLLPPEPVTANELDQFPAGRFSAAVQSPAGQVLGINVSEDFWGDLPPDADVRTIGALTVGTQLEDSSRSYVALDRCAMVAIAAPATIPSWDPTVTDLLAGLTSTDGVVTVALPAGWQQLATGPQTERYNTAFTHTIGTSEHEMRLFQSRNANLAQFLAETYRGTASPITFGQSPAWVVHSNDSLQWNYLIWSTGTTAAMLGGQAISDADLIATAQTLVAVAPSEWIKRVNASLPPVDPATITATTMLATAIGDQSGCGARTIQFD